MPEPAYKLVSSQKTLTPPAEPDRLSKTLAFLTQEVQLTVKKTEVVSVRVPPDVKAALVAAAGRERRSIASMVEFIVMDYCKTNEIEFISVELSK